MKLSRMCKVNKAADGWIVGRILRYNSVYNGTTHLTSGGTRRMIRHSYIYTYAHTFLKQAASAQGLRHSQSQGRSGLSPAVPAVGLLRSPRSGPTQIRSLARAGGRRLLARPGCQRVWIFPPHDLPSPKPVSGTGFGRTVAPQAWPQASAQANVRSAGVSSGTGQGTASPQVQGTGSCRAPALPNPVAPANAGKGLGLQGKKGASNLDVKTTSTTPALWTRRYETLRQYILDSRRSLSTDPLGLVLLLRQGVAGWMHSWRELGVPALTAVPTPVVSPSTPDWQRQLTALLAQMASAHLSVAPLYEC